MLCMQNLRCSGVIRQKFISSLTTLQYEKWLHPIITFLLIYYHNCLVLKVSKALGTQLQDSASNFVFFYTQSTSTVISGQSRTAQSIAKHWAHNCKAAQVTFFYTKSTSSYIRAKEDNTMYRNKINEASSTTFLFFWWALLKVFHIHSSTFHFKPKGKKNSCVYPLHTHRCMYMLIMNSTHFLSCKLVPQSVLTVVLYSHSIIIMGQCC